MALILSELKLPLNAEESSLKEFAARALAMPESAIHTLRVNRISLDARKKEDICFTYTVTVWEGDKSNTDAEKTKPWNQLTDRSFRIRITNANATGISVTIKMNGVETTRTWGTTK